jgi:hypothetical protein
LPRSYCIGFRIIRLLTTFYFYEGLTLKEIGNALKSTQEHASQILKQAPPRPRDIMAGPSSLALESFRPRFEAIKEARSLCPAMLPSARL